MCLELLDEFEVFEHRTISPAQIRYLYRPYSEISRYDPEGRLLRAIERRKKVMVRSWAGAGKTCLINYVISGLAKEYFPIMFPVRMANDRDDLCTDASAFAAFMLSRILGAVRDAKQIPRKQYKQFRKLLSGELAYTEGKKDTLLGKLSSKLSWLPGFAEAGAEVGGQVEEYAEYALREKVYVQDQVACLNKVVALQQEKGISMVVVLDDTDKFLQSGIIDKTELVDKFFVYVAPMFREIDCALIFPAHESYLVHSTFGQAQKTLVDDVIEIPEVSLKGFTQMLDQKVQSVAERKSASDFIEPKAIKLVYDQLYQGKTEERLRNPLRAINESVKSAVADGETKVDFARMAYSLID